MRSCIQLGQSWLHSYRVATRYSWGWKYFAQLRLKHSSTGFKMLLHLAQILSVKERIILGSTLINMIIIINHHHHHDHQHSHHHDHPHHHHHHSDGSVVISVRQ